MTVTRSWCPQIDASISVALGETEGDPYRAQFLNAFNLPREMLFLTKDRSGIETFVDVGANIGHFTLAAGALGIRTVAIEALADNYILLCESVHENGFDHVVPICVAASDHYAAVSMRDHSAYAQVDEDSRGMVAAVPLDALLPSLGAAEPDLIKIDVEGHEILALRGLDRTIAKARPMIILESNNWTNPLGDELLLDELRSRDYDMFMFMNDGSVTPFATDDVQPIVCTDFLAVPGGRGVGRPMPHVRQLADDDRLAMVENEAAIGGDPHHWYFREVVGRLEDRYGKSERLDALKVKLGASD